MDEQASPIRSLRSLIQSHAPDRADGYRLEYKDLHGNIVTKPDRGSWQVAMFEPPQGVPEKKCRVIYVDKDGRALPPKGEHENLIVQISYGLDEDDPEDELVDALVPAMQQRRAAEAGSGGAEGEETKLRDPDYIAKMASVRQSIERNEQDLVRDGDINKHVRRSLTSAQAMQDFAIKTTHQHLTDKIDAMNIMFEQGKQLLTSHLDLMKLAKERIADLQTPPAPEPRTDMAALAMVLAPAIRDIWVSAIHAGQGVRPAEGAATTGPTVRGALPSETASPPRTQAAASQPASSVPAESLRRAASVITSVVADESKLAEMLSSPDRFEQFVEQLRAASPAAQGGAPPASAGSGAGAEPSAPDGGEKAGAGSSSGEGSSEAPAKGAALAKRSKQGPSA